MLWYHSISELALLAETRFAELLSLSLLTHALAPIPPGVPPASHPAKQNKSLCSANKTFQLQECSSLRPVSLKQSFLHNSVPKSPHTSRLRLAEYWMDGNVCSGTNWRLKLTEGFNSPWPVHWSLVNFDPSPHYLPLWLCSRLGW